MSTPKAGSLARKAIAKEAEANAPVDLDVMLGNGPTVNLRGRDFPIYQIPIMYHSRLQKSLDALGEDYVLSALAIRNPDGMARLRSLMNPDGPEPHPEDIPLLVGISNAGMSAEAVEAMAEICLLAFNDDPDNPTILEDVIKRHLSIPAFPSVLQNVLICSGLDPTVSR